MWPSALFPLTRSRAGGDVLSWSCVDDDVLSWSCVGAGVLSRAVAQLRDGEGGMVDWQVHVRVRLRQLREAAARTRPVM